MSAIRDLIRGLTSKKISPTQRITRLKVQSTKLQQREDRFRRRAHRAREDAKDALRRGNERDYSRNSSKYTSNRKAFETTENIHDVCFRLLDLLELSKDLRDIVDIGTSIGDMQKDIGVDTEKLEKAMTNITETLINVETAAEVISTTIDSVLLGNEEISLDQETLRKELLAEIEIEKSEEEELLKEIEKERNEKK